MTPEALAATHAAAFPGERGWSAEEFASLMADGIVTGSAKSFVLGRVTLDEAEVLTLATHPDHRRRGLARSALAAFLAEARARGAMRAFLEVAADNAPARALYGDWTEIGRRKAYYARAEGPAVDALVLEKRLDSPEF